MTPERCPLCGSRPNWNRRFCSNPKCFEPCSNWPAVQALKDESFQLKRNNEEFGDSLQRMSTENRKLKDRVAELERIANSRLCDSCMERHPVGSMCPPHEMRTTGQQWFRDRIKEKDEEIERLKAELAAVKDELSGMRVLYAMVRPTTEADDNDSP